MPDVSDRVLASIPVARALLPGLALIVLGAVGFAETLDAVTERDDLWRVDDPLLEFLVANREPWVTTVLTGVTNLFGPVVLPILVAIGALVWARTTRAWRDPLLFAGAMILSTVVFIVIKRVVGRPRPDEETMAVPGLESSFSFPSGHTAGTATLVLVSGYLIWRRHRTGARLAVWAAASIALILVVAGSRLYLGYHFLTDVIAGFLLGVVVLGVVVAVARWHDLGTVPRSHEGPVRR